MDISNQDDRWRYKAPGELARDPLTWWSAAELAKTFVVMRLEYLADQGTPNERTEAVQLLLHPEAAIEIGRALLSKGERLLAAPPPDAPRN